MVFGLRVSHELTPVSVMGSFQNLWGLGWGHPDSWGPQARVGSPYGLSSAAELIPHSGLRAQGHISCRRERAKWGHTAFCDPGPGATQGLSVTFHIPRHF